MRIGKCYACQRIDLFPDYPALEPQHCYGDGDQPGTKGLYGSGFRCDCVCRKWERPKPQHHDGSIVCRSDEETTAQCDGDA